MTIDAPEDPAFLTVAEAGALIARREISPVELTRRHLDRIEAIDPQLSSFLLVTPEAALAQARAAEAEIAAGHRRGPLHGIPFGLKDVYDTKGLRTTGNSAAFGDRVPEADAAVVERLRRAGAILLGKQATHELTYGGVSDQLPWPPPRNPWNRDHDTGGSSSGSGAAVAAGLAMFALGTDTGGSIRNPAAHCGVVGLKPSFGLVSRSGVMANSHSFDHCGPLARTVLDAALVLDAIAGPDPSDPGSLVDPLGSDYAGALAGALAGGIAGWRIGVLEHLHLRDLPAGAEMRQALASALSVLGELGARVEAAAIAPLERYAACKTTMQRFEIRSAYARSLAERPQSFGSKLRARLDEGKDVTLEHYFAARQEKERLTQEMAGLFTPFDILIAAGPPGPALLADAAADMTFDRPEITVPFSVAGVPAISLCIGFTAAGLPLAMQIVGPKLGDRAVLRAAHAYQTATRWHERHPPLATAIA